MISLGRRDLHALFVRAVDATEKSRYTIAGELGVSETILSRCYTGKRPPSLELLCDVAALAGLRVSIELHNVEEGKR